jgi:aconitate hydratase
MIPTRLLAAGGRRYRIVDLDRLGLDRLPLVHRILIENLVRRGSDSRATAALVAQWARDGASDAEIPFWPSRILMHDTTCGPALVDLAAARAALAEQGVDPSLLNPVLPVDVSTDHSLAVDVYGTSDARRRNMDREMQRNAERYRFMKWASTILDNLRVHPPGTGIMHTINLERLARVVAEEERGGACWAIPDTVIGTDSHTPMVNGIGVLAWGVGGLEAESVMLGMPVMMRVPEVVGVRLTGRLGEGVSATELALAITHRLRQEELGGRFLEYCGPGVSTLSAGERAVVANMAPEYGSATGYFPIDEETLLYLRATGRADAQVDLVEAYARATGLWFDPDAVLDYAERVEFDLGGVALALAGPRRPQDLARPDQVPGLLGGGGSAGGLPRRPVAIAAITSCTNTSDPRQLIAAGLVARKARSFGLAVPDWVKTTLAPGSPAAEQMLARAGLLDDLGALGFAIVGYGCTVCIGNSGPLTGRIAEALRQGAVDPVAILSGNRNFPGRVHPAIQDAFLAAPALVVAFALMGDAARDVTADPIGKAPDGHDVFLADLWPGGAEIDAVAAGAVRPGDYSAAYEAAEANAEWAALAAPRTPLYPWDPRSTYLRPPPFARLEAPTRLGRYAAEPMLVVGDDITTDHISPAGAISPDSEAGRWLIAQGEDPHDLNVFASRRGNWEVMLRGLFTNRAVRNLLGEAIPAGSTIHAPSGTIMPLFEAAALYAEEGKAVVVVAGERYGMGSSRDWAAKGASLLGVRAVLATSFERIHRSNLINMGILPLRLPEDRNPATLGLRPGDSILVDTAGLAPRAPLEIGIDRHGRAESFTVRAEIETDLELVTLQAGGAIPMILRRLAGRG